MLEVFSCPSLRSPVLLCAVSGWSDGAFAASGALRYLTTKRPAERLAAFDPDQIYTYTVTRPMTATQSGRRVLTWPEFAWDALVVPEAPHDLVILVGPEPDLRWRELVNKVLDFAQQLGVEEIITFGCFLAPVHYAQPPTLIGISPDPALQTRLEGMGLHGSNYQGSTGFITAVVDEASRRGLPAASIWTAAPSYLSQMTNPRLSAALLEVAERILGQDLWLKDLEAAGRDVQRRIDATLRARPDLVEYLQNLTGQSVSPEAPESRPDQGELPSAEELLKDLEEHLRRSRGEPPDQPDLGE